MVILAFYGVIAFLSHRLPLNNHAPRHPIAAARGALDAALCGLRSGAVAGNLALCPIARAVGVLSIGRPSPGADARIR